MGAGRPERENECSSQEFASALANLKQTGAAVLCIGEIPESARRQVQNQLFGGDDLARQCIRVSTANAKATVTNQPRARGPSVNQWTNIQYAAATRSTAIRQPATASSSSRQTDYECSSLSELGITISTLIENVAGHADGMPPGALRVGFDSIRPLFEEGEETLFRFLSLLIMRVKEVHGMVHLPLPLPSDAKPVRLLAPLVDAILELRPAGEEIHQRWHLPERKLESGWIPLTVSQ